MEAQKLNLYADTGALLELAGKWTEEGVPKDLSTGWTGALVVTTRDAAPTELVRQAADLDAGGNVVAQVDPDDLPPRGAYAYHLEVTEGTLPPRFLLVGRLTVRDSRDV